MTYIDSLLREAKRTAPPKEEETQAKAEEAAGEVAPPEDKVLVDSYEDVKIYKLPSENGYYYEVPAPRYAGEERVLIYALLDIASNIIVVDPKEAVTKEKIDKTYKEKLLQIMEQTPELKVPINSRGFYADVVLKEMFGFGLIDLLVKDDNLEDIMILGPAKPVYVFHRKYDMMRTNIVYYQDADVRRLIDRIARNIGRRIDTQVPMLDARLPDGTRVNATLPPASIDGATLTLRKFRKDPYTVIDLLDYGTVNAETAAFLWMASDGMGAKPANILIAGGTGSGKTTTLNMLCSFVPNTERVLTIEDTAELNLPLLHWIRFETRPPGIEGTGEITMDMLVKNTLRMRPDRIIVGEIRGAEGFTLFTAMNTGHDGSFGTVHANSARETVTRLLAPPISVPEVMLGALSFIIVQHRINDRRKGVIRRITEIAEVTPIGDGKAELELIYQWDASRDVIEPTGVPPRYFQTLSNYTGLTRSVIMENLQEREKILADLKAAGKRSMSEVCDVTQKYILKKGRGY
jgi:flagellar protein FlaI